MIKNTKEIFINNATKVHGTKYDYSLVEYLSNDRKVKIICSKHGIFEQMPRKHVNAKQGCPICGSVSTHEKQTKTTEKFISEAKIVHGDRYDYSLVDYQKNKNIKIICPEHGVFEQTPTNHLSGKGCKYCGGTAKMDTVGFIKKAKMIHGDKYDYSQVNYINAITKVKIICPEHGEFEQIPNNHLSKNQGCYDCLGKIYDTDSFKKICSIIHNNKYDYSHINYINITSELEIICPIHGVFKQRGDSHRNGGGCLKCSNNGGPSIIEKELKDFIKSLNIEIVTNTKKIISPLELDIFIPSHNIAIEFNGLYWHNEIYKDNDYHLNKTQLCEEKGIQLIHIFEDEWLDKQDIVKSRLKNILGLTSNKIYARKCIIKEVSSKDTKKFVNDNHIQGNVNSKYCFGLYHNDELVSVMTFSKRPMINNKEFELLRFCNKLNTTVVGGANKLLQHFIKTYQPKEIISYADRRWSRGNLYEKLGFKFTHNSKPNYSYVIGKNRENRFKYQKHKLIKEGYDSNKSEHNIMLERGIYRIYDCGNKVYLFL